MNSKQIRNTILKSFFWIFLFFSCHSYGQVLLPGDYTREYYQLLSLKNEIEYPIVLHPSIISQYKPDSTLKWNLWGDNFKLDVSTENKKNFTLVNPQITFLYNTKNPMGLNDGAVWNGGGLNTSLTGGFYGNIGILHFAFVPTVYYAQNKSLFIPENNFNKSEFSYPVEDHIDWVQRFGNGSLNSFHPGQSEVRLIYKNATIGFSTQNMNWGPSTQNPILMSSNAGGFPHIDIGTAKPAKTIIGKLEFKNYWGILKESDYFDDNDDNDRRYFTGFIFGYSPKYIKGLSVSFNKVLYKRWRKSVNDVVFKDLFASITQFFLDADEEIVDGRLTNDSFDQIASITLDWKFPSVGFEAYMEFAKNDFPGKFSDVFNFPDRSRAYTIGFLKTIDFENGNVFKIQYETTTLSANQTSKSITAGNPNYYVHSIVDQGYTHQGQIIGAGIGPGSNSNFLQLTYYHKRGKIGAHIRRIRYNDDVFFDTHIGQQLNLPIDLEISTGVHAVHFYKKFAIRPEFVWSHRKNWFFDDSVDRTNFQFSLRTTYNIN